MTFIYVQLLIMLIACETSIVRKNALHLGLISKAIQF